MHFITHTYAHACTHTHTHTHTHIHMFTCAHMHSHTHTHHNWQHNTLHILWQCFDVLQQPSYGAPPGYSQPGAPGGYTAPPPGAGYPAGYAGAPAPGGYGGAPPGGYGGAPAGYAGAPGSKSLDNNNWYHKYNSIIINTSVAVISIEWYLIVCSLTLTKVSVAHVSLYMNSRYV